MRVLLVDHDSEALENITRAIRGVLELDCVTSKGDALLLLRQNTYDVLIACERCVDGSGLDLLGRTTRTTVPLKRVFAAAPERLQLLGPRLAPFKVQRTINYPIELEELWLAIAQVTGTSDDTDGTIERVVLDERGIPSSGTTPRSPIPARPPAPLAEVVPMVARAPAAAANPAASGIRAAAVRVPQAAPAPEPPLRAPPPPRPVPAPPRAVPPMRATAPPVPPLAPMSPRADFPGWTQEPAVEDDFAEVAAQARLGVQQKAADEHARRKRQRILTACGIAVVVAGAIVFLIERFYDPAARAREKAIAAEVSRMAEQQKVTDDLTMTELDIEKAIMDNDLELARKELAALVEKSPNHPRREFLQASIDRAAELAKLAPAAKGSNESTSAPAQAAVLPSPPARANDRPRPENRPVDRPAERAISRPPEKSAPQVRAANNNPPPGGRVYGAPIGDSPPPPPPVRLDAPINSPPTSSRTPSGNSFGGRTVEASDAAVTRAPPPTAAPASYQTNNAAATPAGSAAVAPSVAPPPPAAIDVVPAKLVKQVTPVAPIGIPAKAKGYVLVRFSISETGRVGDLEVVDSQPRGMFDEAARTAVRKWIYEPRKENGVAVASKAQARLVFEAAN